MFILLIVLCRGSSRLEQNFENPITRYTFLWSCSLFPLLLFSSFPLLSLLHRFLIIGISGMSWLGMSFASFKASICPGYNSSILWLLTWFESFKVNLKSCLRTLFGIEFRQDLLCVLCLSMYWICWVGFAYAQNDEFLFLLQDISMSRKGKVRLVLLVNVFFALSSSSQGFYISIVEFRKVPSIILLILKVAQHFCIWVKEIFP